jgi:carbonic anhydrase
VVKAILFFLLTTSLLQAGVTPEKALQNLVEGNKRFVEGSSVCPDRTAERRKETEQMQEPFAVILGCADSRVAPEIIFDQGIGDLFIVRVAGNVAGPVEVASVEYSAIYLHSSLILVLGHENCGAIKAVMAGKTQDIEPVAKLIEPAVKKNQKEDNGRLEKSIKDNVKYTVEELKKNPALAALIAKKQLQIKGGYYNFHTGAVELLN